MLKATISDTKFLLILYLSFQSPILFYIKEAVLQGKPYFFGKKWIGERKWEREWEVNTENALKKKVENGKIVLLGTVRNRNRFLNQNTQKERDKS